MHQEKRILQYRRGLVKYYDPDTFHMEISNETEIPFYKRDEFIHQKEYRIVIYTGTVGKLKVVHTQVIRAMSLWINPV